MMYTDAIAGANASHICELGGLKLLIAIMRQHPRNKLVMIPARKAQRNLTCACKKNTCNRGFVSQKFPTWLIDEDSAY